MATTSISGGGDHNVMVYGSGTVVAGNGNDAVNLLGSGKVTAGNGQDTIALGGNGTVSAGSGNDRIQILGNGSISVGGGNDTLTMVGTGAITQLGVHGHDTINLGNASDTIYAQGNATVQSANLYQHFPASHLPRGRFTSGHGAMLPPTVAGATIAGGELEVRHVNGVTEDVAVSGSMTLLGGSGATEFIGGGGSTVMKGGSGNDTFIGGSGHDTLIGGSGHNVFEFISTAQGGHHVITNFVSADQLNVEGHTLAYLMAHNEVTTRNGNTYISIDGGKTTIELQGFTEAAPARPQFHLHIPRDKP